MRYFMFFFHIQSSKSHEYFLVKQSPLGLATFQVLKNHYAASGYHIGQIQHLRPGLQEQSHAATWWLHRQMAA